MQRVCEFSGVAKRLEHLDGFAPGGFGLIVPRLHHQRHYKASGCPSATEVIPELCENLDCPSSDAFALGDAISCKGFGCMLPEQLASLKQWDLEPICQAF